MLVNVNGNTKEIKDQDIIDSWNHLADVYISNISELSEEDLIYAIENDDYIMSFLLGENFEGEYNINLL